jgi:hypothetical protein
MRETRNHRSPSAMTAIAPFKAVSISPALWAERMMSARTTHSPLLTQEAGYLVIEAADGAANLKILQ